uniref:Zinc finger protein 513 n=1 Tax=Paramormyrops kingsleyae TaxID=1676925 RepID=A0A3B3RPC5_9TELE|nr:zinc finger protein 513 [Paramormyrops kingsleyae]
MFASGVVYKTSFWPCSFLCSWQKQGLSHTRLSMDDNVQDIQDAQGKQDYSSMPCLACRGRTHLLTDPQGSGEDLAGVSGFGCGTGAGEVAERAQRGVAKGRDDAVAGDGELKLHSCELCGFSTRYANHVKRHMKTHSGERPYRCPLCAYASGQLVNLQRHVRVHTGEKPYQCRLCAFACSSLGNLKRHQRMHTLGRHGRHPGGNQARLMAGQRSGKAPPGDLDTVAANRAAHVSGDGSYSAASPACESGSPPDTEKPAKGAGEAAGGGEGGLPGPPFSQACRLCGRDTTERGSSCGRICGRCMLDVLSKELPRVLGGGGEKAYPCAVCPFVTHYPNHLVRHMKTHSGEKPYRCPECDYASAHLDNLKRHHRVHTGEKPYRCQLCDYACGNLANLRRHQRVHSGAKPFQCTVCNYSCNQSMNLKRHMLRHTGCKPFCCPECPYATGHWDNYKRHQRKHGRPAGGWLRVRLPNDGGGEEEEEEGAEEEAQLDQLE